MTRDQALRELAKHRDYCPRCDELRDSQGGPIVHRKNCPIMVALSGESGEKNKNAND